MRTPTLILALTLSLTACGGATDPASLNDAGANALGSGDYTEAATQFDAALTALGADTSSAQYQRATWGMIQAAAHADPARAESDFLEFAKSNSATTSENDYIKVISWLADAKAFEQAANVGAVGLKLYSESPDLDAAMKDAAKKAVAAGDTSGSDAMSSLGYMGDD